MNRRFQNLPVLMTVTLLLAGCGREDIRVYRVAKEQSDSPPPPAMAQGTMPGAMPAGHPEIGSAPARLTWKTPDGWNEAAAGGMRVASFKVSGPDGKQADVSVIPLAGAAGGDFANVNLWREQVGQLPVNAAELEKLAEAVTVADQPASLYDIPGKGRESGQPARILGAILHREGTAWFFKMTGDDQFVAGQKAAFVEFLKSIRFQAGSTPMETAAMPPMPAGHPDVSGAATAGAPASEGKPNWQPPPGWKEVPGGQFLVAKFTIGADASAQAAVNVSMSAGDGGGMLANVNRWRQQLKLTPVSEAELGKLTTSMDIAGGQAVLVDMNGTDVRTGQPSRVVGALVPRTGQTWFYKLMGDAGIVEAQKEAFTKFVQTVKY